MISAGVDKVSFSSFSSFWFAKLEGTPQFPSSTRVDALRSHALLLLWRNQDQFEHWKEQCRRSAAFDDHLLIVPYQQSPTHLDHLLAEWILIPNKSDKLSEIELVEEVRIAQQLLFIASFSLYPLDCVQQQHFGNESYFKVIQMGGYLAQAI